MPRRLWVDTVVSESIVVAGESFVNLLTSLTGTEGHMLQMTLIRTIVGLDVARLTHDSGEGSERIAMGIGVTSREAISLGTSALPNPAIETDFPTRGWVWRAHYRTYGFAADQPAVFNQRIDLDLRSMRKLDNGVPYLMLEMDNLEGTSSVVQALGMIRMLFQVT